MTPDAAEPRFRSLGMLAAAAGPAGLAVLVGLLFLIAVPRQVFTFQTNGVAPPAVTRTVLPAATQLNANPAVGLLALALVGGLLGVAGHCSRRRWGRVFAVLPLYFALGVVGLVLAMGVLKMAEAGIL